MSTIPTVNSSYTGNSSLLNLLNQSGKSTRGAKMQAIFQKSIMERRQVISDLFKEKFGMTSASDDTTAYKSIASKATAAGKVMGSLSAEEEPNLYTEALESGDHTQVYAKVKEFVKNYQSLRSDMQKLGGTIESAYGAKMDAYLEKYEEQLAKIGITVKEDNSLSIDEETLKSADLEDIKAIFAQEDGFSDKLASTLSNIVDIVEKAVNIRESLTQTYNSKAGLTSSKLGGLYNSQG